VLAGRRRTARRDLLEYDSAETVSTALGRWARRQFDAFSRIPLELSLDTGPDCGHSPVRAAPRTSRNSRITQYDDSVLMDAPRSRATSSVSDSAIVVTVCTSATVR